MSQQSDPRIDKAQERVNRAQEMESRYDMVLRSYQALGRVTPETLVNYNAYLKEYHVLMLEIMNGLKEQTNEVRRIQDETENRRAETDLKIEKLWAERNERKALLEVSLALREADPSHVCPTCGADYGSDDGYGDGDTDHGYDNDADYDKPID